MDHLIKLDTIKTKLKATSKALQEADNWTTLMADIEEVRKTSNIENDFIFNLFLLHYSSLNRLTYWPCLRD